MASDKESLLSTPLHGLLIPSALIIAGTLIVKPEWTLYGIILAASLSALKVYRGTLIKTLNAEKFQSFPLIEKTILTHNTAIYRFELPSSKHILGLPIGQHIQISANIDGKEIVRSYTPVSSDEDKGYFDVLVKSYPTGNISKHLATLPIGSSINVKGPKGNFKYTPNMVKSFGMLAGGTGLAPMLQIIQAIVKNPQDKTKVNLIFANVTHEDILLKPELDALAKNHSDQVTVTYVLNQAPEKWDGYTGFITTDIIKKHISPPSEDVKLLICGPPPMVSAMKKAAVELGFQKARPVSKAEDQVFAF